MASVTTVECSSAEFAIIDDGHIIFCRVNGGARVDRDYVVRILARDLQETEADEPPCTVIGYCQTHQCGGPHSMTGRQYLE